MESDRKPAYIGEMRLGESRLTEVRMGEPEPVSKVDLYLNLADNMGKLDPKHPDFRHIRQMLGFGLIGLNRQMDDTERQQLADTIEARQREVKKPNYQLLRQ